MQYSPEVLERARRVRLFLCDVDGVLTDATVTMGGGVESKNFHIRDGLGLRLLRQHAGIRVGWISARPSTATIMRAEDLKVDFLKQSPAPKVEVVEGLLAECGLKWEEALYMGDDVVDLGVMRRAGLATAPADAIEEVRSMAHWVCSRPGGKGAVREAVDLVLKAQGYWDSMVAKFAS